MTVNSVDCQLSIAVIRIIISFKVKVYFQIAVDDRHFEVRIFNSTVDDRHFEVRIFNSVLSKVTFSCKPN